MTIPEYDPDGELWVDKLMHDLAKEFECSYIDVVKVLAELVLEEREDKPS